MKVLIHITRLASKHVPFEVHGIVLKGAKPQYDYNETFSCMETGSLPLPAAAYRLKVGESIRVKCNFHEVWTRDYFGKYDVRLDYYGKERVIWRNGKGKKNE